MRLIGRFVWLVVTVIMVITSMIFAASNDSEVTLLLWPFETGLTMPAWLSVLGALGIGLLTGGLMVWLSTISIRLRIWQSKNELKKMEKKIKSAESRLAEAEHLTTTDSILIPGKR